MSDVVSIGRIAVSEQSVLDAFVNPWGYLGVSTSAFDQIAQEIARPLATGVKS